MRDPLCNLYKLFIISIRSEVFFTGKNLLHGTFISILPSNDFIAAPTAVSSYIIFKPLVKVLSFTIISIVY